MGRMLSHKPFQGGEEAKTVNTVRPDVKAYNCAQCVEPAPSSGSACRHPLHILEQA